MKIEKEIIEEIDKKGMDIEQQILKMKTTMAEIIWYNDGGFLKDVNSKILFLSSQLRKLQEMQYSTKEINVWND